LNLLRSYWTAQYLKGWTIRNFSKSKVTLQCSMNQREVISCDKSNLKNNTRDLVKISDR
jgi:hypothetical protein